MRSKKRIGKGWIWIGLGVVALLVISISAETDALGYGSNDPTWNICGSTSVGQTIPKTYWERVGKAWGYGCPLIFALIGSI